MKVYNLSTTNGKLNFSTSGDVMIGVANNEYANCLLVTNKSEFKKTPIVGVGIQNWLNAPFTSSNTNNLQSVINEEFTNDGFLTNDLVVDYNLKASEYTIKIDSNRFK